MNRRDLIKAGVVSLAVAAGKGTGAQAVPSSGITRIVRDGAGYTMTRDGKPYFVRGAGGHEQLALLRSLGGNSIRTWGADTARRDLDAAHALGLTVTVGIWLGHAEHGFKYDDPKMVREQFETARNVVREFKNHPALLAWGIGNEMEGDGNIPHVWEAVQQIAAMARGEDPNHPTMTVIAEIGADAAKAKAIQTLCPDIDVIGINSYGGLASLADRLKAAGITKPYMVTEFGPNGTWEVGKTKWNAPLELSSTEKARVYLGNYLRSIQGQPTCLGSYAFVWGDKVEGTQTWYGLFVHGTGERLGATDALSFLWTGKWSVQNAPDIMAFQTSVAEKEVKPSSPQTVTAVVRSVTPLTYEYVIRPEKIEEARHEPGQKLPEPVHVAASNDGTANFTAPAVPGAYRLYLTVRDAANKTAATANTPFLVAA